MTTEDGYEEERTATPEEAAAVLSGVADGLLTGSIRLGEGAEALRVDVPDSLSLEVEFEQEDGELSLELEMDWPAPEGEEAVTPIEGDEAAAAPEGEKAAEEGGASEGEATAVEPVAAIGAADATQSLARFEVFQDRGDQWRWRLRHRNGNIIATSGEGYTRKHNAWNGLESVMENAPEAAVREDVE